MLNTPFYKKCLQDELARRCERNRGYSLRAFARALGCDPGTLSRFLNGKQVPTVRAAQKLFSRMDLSPEDQRHFIVSLAHTQREQSTTRLTALNGILKQAPLNIDLYRVIADWYHMAILELTYVDSFHSDPKWIAKELGITATEAKLAIARLLDLGLLKKEKGKLVKSDEQLSTTDKSVTTSALRKNQRQFLEIAVQSLENDPIEDRCSTAMTMAIDPDRIEEARKMIQEFNRVICSQLEAGKRKRVYNLSVCLYPLQRRGK